MAKYVCDFDQVYQIGEKVCESVEQLESSIGTYTNNIDSDLTGWDGMAKDAFIKTKNEQVTAAKADFTYVKELGEFIKNSSKSIQELEEQLAGLSI